MQKYKFWDELYGVSYELRIGDPALEIEGQCIADPKECVRISLRALARHDGHSIGVLCHEALHAALDVLRHKGLVFTTDAADEALTYYQEWIVRKCLEKIAIK